MAQAKTLYAEGVELFRAGRFAEAARKFQAAYNRHQSPTLLYNLARAHEEMDDQAGAIDHYQTYLDRFSTAADAPDVRARLAANQAALRARAPGYLVMAGLPPEGALYIDDRRQPPQPDGRWQLRKGEHVLRVERPGYLPWRSKVRIETGKTVAATYQPTAPVPKPVIAPAPEPTGWMTIAGWSAMGAGAAALIGGGVVHARANDERDTYDSAAADIEGRRASPAQLSRLNGAADAYEEQRGRAVALYVTGAALAGVGLTLVLLDGGDTPAEPAGRVAVGASPGGVWLSGAF